MNKKMILTTAAIVAGALALLGWRLASPAIDAAQSEFGTKAVLERHKWFKTASAELDQKAATIAVYDAKAKALEQAYEGKPRDQWPRGDREEYNQSQAELAGLKASYNRLAAEYNAASSTFNWERLKTPDQPLRREYQTK